MKDDRINIAYIADCIRRIQVYTRDGQAAFVRTQMIQDAVIRNFQVIGEATKNLSDEFKLTYSDVPWRKIAGFRDVISHNYISLDLEVVWKIVQDELPNLRPKIEAIAQNLEGDV
jgi:uncharacterized protein with HEPN domain